MKRIMYFFYFTLSMISFMGCDDEDTKSGNFGHSVDNVIIKDHEMTGKIGVVATYKIELSYGNELIIKITAETENYWRNYCGSFSKEEVKRIIDFLEKKKKSSEIRLEAAMFFSNENGTVYLKNYYNTIADVFILEGEEFLQDLKDVYDKLELKPNK